MSNDQTQAASVEAAAHNLREAKTKLDREQSRAAGSKAHIDAANEYQFAIVKLAEAAIADRRTQPAGAGAQAGVAQGEPVGEVVDGPVVGCGIQTRDFRFYDSRAKVGDKLYLAAPTQPAAPASAQPADHKDK